MIVMSDLNRELSERLRLLFDRKNIKTTKLSEKFGKSRGVVSSYLNGRAAPTYDFFAFLSNEIPDLDMNWLISGRGNMQIGFNDESIKNLKIADMIYQQGLMLQSFIALNNKAGEDPSLAKFVDVYGTGDLIIGYNTLKERVAYC